MTTPGMFRAAVASALTIVLLASCGSDTVTSPIFGAGCQQGTLQPGDTIVGAFTTTSCMMDFDWYSYNRSPYVGYAVTLTQGKAYQIFLEHVPDPAHDSLDGLDARLTLFTQNSDGQSIPLAASDDDANHLNSEIWFVAPVSGTFELVAQSYDATSLGGYRLEMNECPVLGVLDTAGTYNLTLGPSPCWRHRAGNNTADTSGYSFVSLNAAAGEGVSTSITSAAFAPRWEQFGPGFDVYGKIYDATSTASGTGSGATATMSLDASAGGLVTVGIGGAAVDSAAGAFSITLTRTPPAAPPAPAAQWSLSNVAQMALRPRPAPKTH